MALIAAIETEPLDADAVDLDAEAGFLAVWSLARCRAFRAKAVVLAGGVVFQPDPVGGAQFEGGQHAPALALAACMLSQTTWGISGGLTSRGLAWAPFP